MADNVYVTGEVWEDRDRDRWKVLPNGYFHCALLDLTKTAERVELLYGPLRRYSVPFTPPSEPGAVYKDRDGDTWRVQAGGKLHCRAHDMTNDRAYVERNWGPLTLATPDPVPAEAAWGEALSRAGAFGDQINEPAEFRLTLDAELVDRVAASYDSGYLGEAVKVYGAALELLVRKSADYGPMNIAQSPGGPLNGLRVRMWDKTARLNHLVDSGAEPENESLRDTFVDLLNYAAIGLMVLDGNWPGASNEGN
jgi:hypothetical protein